MAIGTLLWSNGGRDPCPGKFACFRNTTLANVQYCVDTFWTVSYPDALRKGIEHEAAYSYLSHETVEKCGWQALRSNIAGTVYYKVDNNTASIPYETIRSGARSAIMMLHNNCPWWDLILVIGVPLFIISFIAILALRGHNKKARAREEREQEQIWARKNMLMNAEDESSDNEPMRKVVKKSSKKPVAAKLVVENAV